MAGSIRNGGFVIVSNMFFNRQEADHPVNNREDFDQLMKEHGWHYVDFGDNPAVLDYENFLGNSVLFGRKADDMILVFPDMSPVNIVEKVGGGHASLMSYWSQEEDTADQYRDRLDMQRYGSTPEERETKIANEKERLQAQLDRLKKLEKKQQAKS